MPHSQNLPRGYHSQGTVHSRDGSSRAGTISSNVRHILYFQTNQQGFLHTTEQSCPNKIQAAICPTLVGNSGMKLEGFVGRAGKEKGVSEQELSSTEICQSLCVSSSVALVMAEGTLASPSMSNMALAGLAFLPYSLCLAKDH